jgi:hypothetical protein
MPPTTLPAPEIEIGSRLPVHWNMPRFFTVECEAVHKKCGKLRSGAPKTGQKTRIFDPGKPAFAGLISSRTDQLLD